MGRIFTLVIGGIAGAIGGLLFAPRTGKETREQIKSKIDETMEGGFEKYGEQPGRLLEMASERGQMLRVKIEDAREQMVSGVDNVADKVREKMGVEAEKAGEAVEVVEEKIEAAKEEVEAVEPAETPEADVEEAPSEEAEEEK
ncbi:MAG: YtxH domain-containing protein [Candidatus Aquicultor sp.]|nr:YtxH domain-containing protein [Candidatus Aquicultor sp.]